jgi:hypothetical protein
MRELGLRGAGQDSPHHLGADGEVRLADLVDRQLVATLPSNG